MISHCEEFEERRESMEKDQTTSAAVANKKMETRSILDGERKSPQAVVALELLDHHMPLRDAWIGTLKEKRYISLTMKIVSNILPGMSHLKRCSEKRLILAFAAPDKNQHVSERYYSSSQELENLLIKNGIDLSIFQDKFEVISVPAYQQRTKSQARAASKIWPINFHPDPVIERILNGNQFDQNHLDMIERCMDVCIEAAVLEAHGNEECNGSAVVFDPMSNKIVAIAAAKMDRHPMWHAAMLAIDLVASLGGEKTGAYGLNVLVDELTEQKDQETRKRKHSMNQRDEDWQRKQQQEPLAYPANLIDIACRYASGSSSEIANPVGRKSSFEESNSTGYLCTDYWIFLLREPCPLCAMALLHSRVSNVFYGLTNRCRGVLGSRALLQATPGLNHRYLVWKGVREQECEKAFNEISLRVRTDDL